MQRPFASKVLLPCLQYLPWRNAALPTRSPTKDCCFATTRPAEYRRLTPLLRAIRPTTGSFGSSTPRCLKRILRVNCADSLRNPGPFPQAESVPESASAPTSPPIKIPASKALPTQSTPTMWPPAFSASSNRPPHRPEPGSSKELIPFGPPARTPSQ